MLSSHAPSVTTNTTLLEQESSDWLRILVIRLPSHQMVKMTLNHTHTLVVLVGGLSGLFFTVIVMLASYITTYFMSAFEESTTSHYAWSFFYVSPFEVAQDLVVAALRILKEGGIDSLFDEAIPTGRNNLHTRRPDRLSRSTSNPGFIKRFVKRFLLGLPLVGAGSLVHMLLSVGYLLPVQWLARYRGNRNRRDNSRDVAALIVVALLAVGAIRWEYHVLHLTNHYPDQNLELCLRCINSHTV